MGEEDALRENLSDRLLRFADGDRAAVFGPAAERAARDLLNQALGRAAEGMPTLSVVDAYLLGLFHWCRYQALPPGERSAEVGPIRRYFTPMVTVDPEHVPEGVCELLSDDPQERARATIMVVGVRLRKHLDAARQAKDVGELNMAIGLLQALPLRDLPDDMAIHFYVTLSRAWSDRYNWAGDPADLDRAIAQCLAVRATGQSGVEAEYGYQGDLDKLLTRRYELTRRAEHLDEVVTERAARLADAADADRSHWRMQLASSLANRLERSGDPADLREAADQCRAAAAETTGEDRGRAFTLLFRIQSHAFFAGEQPIDDLSEVIATGEAALEFLPEDEKNVVPALRTNVGYFQLRRYERTGDSTDLANALELHEKAAETLPEDDARRVTARARLAEALVMRHKETVRQSTAHGFGRAVFSDLQRAIDLLTWCVDQTSADGGQRAGFLRSLADAYRAGADTDDRPDMLDKAVDALREVVALGGDDPSTALHELARALRGRFMALRHEADLTEAIGLSEKAIASAGTGTHEELTAQLGLAESLAMRLILDPSNDADRRAALEIYRRVARAKSAGVAARVSASYAWARVAHDGDYLAEALDGYESMLTLMAEMAPIGLDDADRLRLLAQEDRRPALAVGCAVATGQFERAVELLEQGRMMTAPAVSVAADDVEALRQRRPDLAEIVGAAQAELTATASNNEVMFLPGATGMTEGWQDLRQRRDAAARHWQDAVARVRGVPGFEGFLAPAGFAVLRNAAQAGPVVVLNASPYRCDALIVRISGVDVVPLPVTYEEVLAWANRYGGAVSELNRAVQTLAARQAAEDELWQVLAWLWDGTAEPVLDALGLLGVVASGSWPRVWWSPGGLFSLFPLHAAGRTPEDGVMDRVQSSYAPSLRLLASLNATADGRTAGRPQRLLAVGLTQTPGLKNSHLPDVSRELAAATAACPAERQTVLRDALATRAAVEAALPEHDVLHFACHGRQYPRDPLSSELHLYDRPLSVRDLRWSSLRRARLAVLSACQTALGGTTLMDEGLHLGAALHMAGCRDVVGTLWTVPDSSAVEIMERLYGHLRRDGELKPGLAAEALHLAVRDLRSDVADLCGAWAPFVHVGGGR